MADPEIEKINEELLEALREVLAAIQSLDLESDYYIDGKMHPHVKQSLIASSEKGQAVYQKARGR